MLQEFLVNNLYSPIRLDKYLRILFPYINQSLVEKSLRQKLILVNDQKSTSNHRVINNDIIKINEKLANQLKTNLSDIRELKYIPNIKFLNIVKKSIIYEDDNLIAINKPGGLAAQAGTNIIHSADRIMAHLYPEILPKILHRLDKETSGVMLFAKNLHYAQVITKLFAERKVKKTYYAMVFGSMREKEMTIEEPLMKANIAGEDKIVVHENGEYALTRVKFVRSIGENSLLEINPHTGRKHQIRVHLAHINRPILGDRKYNPHIHRFKTNHLFLHAYKIEIPELKLVISQELPDYFNL